MYELVAAIRSVGDAADNLTRACARHGAIADASANENAFVTALRKTFRASGLTPSDMLTTLGKLK